MFAHEGGEGGLEWGFAVGEGWGVQIVLGGSRGYVRNYQRYRIDRN